MKELIEGQAVSKFYYESEGDYFVMEFEDGTENCFRFMADILHSIHVF